jgi:hypothetical protein
VSEDSKLIDIHCFAKACNAIDSKAQARRDAIRRLGAAATKHNKKTKN